MSVKELAQHLGEPQTKLYRHVKQLEAAGLIEVAATRMVDRARKQDGPSNGPDEPVMHVFDGRVSLEAAERLLPAGSRPTTHDDTAAARWSLGHGNA
jgi:DNA-binding transcriptional ArsR family regulator